jgi:hypothetical protein
MRGVLPNLPLDGFVGRAFNQIALGRFQIQFRSDRTGSIDVEGRWDLRKSAGELVDAWIEHEKRETYRLHAIIDVPIVGYEINPPRSFTIAFENGYRLTVFDETPKYEAFSVNLLGHSSTYV